MQTVTLNQMWCVMKRVTLDVILYVLCWHNAAVVFLWRDKYQMKTVGSLLSRPRWTEAADFSEMVWEMSAGRFTIAWIDVFCLQKRVSGPRDHLRGVDNPAVCKTVRS